MPLRRTVRLPSQAHQRLFRQFQETVRKGFERCSNREFGRYAEHEIGQKRASRQPVGLRHECVQDFSDSFR
jgi:hypothetical protein